MASELIVIREPDFTFQLPLLLPSFYSAKSGDFFDFSKLLEKVPHLWASGDIIDYPTSLRKLRQDISLEDFDALPFHKKVYFVLPSLILWDCKSFHATFLKLLFLPEIPPTIYYVLTRPLLERMCFLYRIQTDSKTDSSGKRFVYKVIDDLSQENRKKIYEKGLLFSTRQTVDWVARRHPHIAEAWKVLSSVTHFGSATLHQLFSLSRTKNPNKFGWEHYTPEEVFGEIDKLLRIIIGLVDQSEDIGQKIDVLLNEGTLPKPFPV